MRNIALETPMDISLLGCTIFKVSISTERPSLQTDGRMVVDRSTLFRKQLVNIFHESIRLLTTTKDTIITESITLQMVI